MNVNVLSAAGVLFAGLTATLPAQERTIPAAINQLGLDLLALPPEAGGPEVKNALLSPYSISTALAMAYVGADGVTRDEMRRVLHLPADDAVTLDGFAGLSQALADLEERSRRAAEQQRKFGGGEIDPVTIAVANRLYAQRGYDFRPAFTALVRDRFGAPLDIADFARDPDSARTRINAWVAEQTRDKIRDLIPPRALDQDTRAVLVNALYLRAPWAEPFDTEGTGKEPFWVGGDTRVDVAMMRQQEDYRYEKREGYVALALPYAGGGVQFLILLPDARDGLPALEKKVTPDVLASGTRLPLRDVTLHLPKLKIEPPTLPLGDALRSLGMRAAFDEPKGSANFDRMAPRRPDDYLAISEVFHQTWMALDEKGTEAAAATAVTMMTFSAAPMQKPPPVEVRVDRPFLFAIQHVASGVCLFLGRVTDPR